jgi:hypothetical protein
VEPLDLKFDMTSGDTVVFIKLLAARSKEMGWSEGAMNITRFDIDTTGTAPNIKDLFTQYGQIPAKVIKERCDKFVTGPDVQTRASQNNAMMQKCLLASLTDEARRKLTACEADYIFNNEVYAPLLFKTIMRLATIDSKATANFLRESLNNCDSYMVKCSSDINQFNLFFTTTYTQLLGRGESVDDPLVPLWKGYLAAQDHNFHAFIERKQQDYFEEKDDMKDLDYTKLMTQATNKFNTLTQEGKWGAKSPDELKILALSAEMAELKGQLKLSNKMKTPDKGKEKGNPKGKDKDQKDGKKKGKNNKNKNKNKEKQKADEAWKKTPPSPGQPNTKKVGEKTHHWCNEHMSWVQHTPEECNLAKKRAEAATEPAKSVISNQALVPGLTAFQAMMGNWDQLHASSQE